LKVQKGTSYPNYNFGEKRSDLVKLTGKIIFKFHLQIAPKKFNAKNKSLNPSIFVFKNLNPPAKIFKAAPWVKEHSQQKKGFII